MKVITVYNAKGGCGKTATAVNLSAALAAHTEQRVLLIDLDWQGNATTSIGLAPRQIPNNTTIADAIMAQLLAPETAQQMLEICIRRHGSDDNKREEFDIVPANALLQKLDLKQQMMAFESIAVLADLISGLNYDFIIFDMPPVLDNLLYAAYYASDYVLIPTEAEFLSHDGLENTLLPLQMFCQDFQKNIEIAGILLTKTSRSQTSVVMESVSRAYADDCGIHCFDVTIPRSAVVPKSNIEGVSAIKRGYSNVKSAYVALADEVMAITRIGVNE